MTKSVGVLAIVGLSACAAQWSVPLKNQPGALISVWGTSSTDVWAVGGDPGSGPEVLHLTANGWTRLSTGVTGDVWWVFGFERGPVFFGGSKGLTLRRLNDAFEVIPPPAPTAATVFGLWGTSPTSLWAVGGDGNTNAFAWRFDGSAWRDVPLPAGVSSTNSLFKVWGRAENDVWFVGSKGLCLHWNGSAFEQIPTPTNRTLFTLHGTATRLAAVGGFGTGVLLEYDGTAWSDVTPPDTKQLLGVRLNNSGGWAVGGNGTMLSRSDKGWVPETGAGVFDDLHAVWLDPNGGVWAVGGQIAALPLTEGTLAHFGVGPVSTVVR